MLHFSTTADPDGSQAPDSPPPPAYEFCQQEFDQKISHALEASQNDQPQQRSGNDDDGEWEVWDETIFAAAAAGLTLSDANTSTPSNRASVSGSNPAPTLRQSSSSTGASSGSDCARAAIQPLRIVKKNSVKEKERPSWYTEAQLDREPTPPAAAESSSSSHLIASGQSSPRTSRTPEREPTPPPEFTELGPDLDGPPYEPYEAQGPPEVTLSYTPGDSNPPSPLASPTIPPSHDPFFHSAPISQTSFNRSFTQLPAQHEYPRTLPAVPDTRQQSVMNSNQPSTQVRPSVSMSNIRPRYGNPRVAFDPQLAYRSEHTGNRAHEDTMSSQKIDAAAFYNSAVSAVYTTGRGSTMRTPVPNNSYGHMRHSTAQPQLHAPQPRIPLQVQGTAVYGAGRTSPAPSVQSMQSSYSQDYTNNRHSTYQFSTPQPSINQANTTSYQPTSYQATSYHGQGTSHQPTSYQPSSYQPTAYSGANRRW
ncbi:hypothetical protein NM688_g2359 [Phlebia brevispora]|uniref:Uncharacterized protein n=1 Tax=Phlebia brevispora TaxID=194682 RepID=A0ACC1T9I1_9APHY|nr:hypothetical protein NM688_g2359 [Phlebia brevispora]